MEPAGPKIHIGKALLALLYVHLGAATISLLFSILLTLDSRGPIAVVIVRDILGEMLAGLTVAVLTSLLPFLLGLAVHVIVGDRLARQWLGLLLAATCASAAALQTLALIELIADRPLERDLVLFASGPCIPLIAIWAGLYARSLPKPNLAA